MTVYDLFNKGWTVEKASLYDEEGVEGWRWFDENYDERSTVIGSWTEEPPLPDVDNLEQILATTSTGETEG